METFLREWRFGLRAVRGSPGFAAVAILTLALGIGAATAIFSAASALLLAAIGIYGIVAFSVARRTREIGIRMALGAERRDVLRLVVGESARLAAAGIVLGFAASLAVTRLVAGLLFGVGATDPPTFAAVAALLAGAALAASYLPARRAMRLDPNAALRVD